MSSPSGTTEPAPYQYPHLTKSASRWRLLPADEIIENDRVIKDTSDARDILLFLKNVPNTETALQDQIQGALEQLEKIGYNYERATGGRVRKRRLQGNRTAQDHMREHDDLIRLARTMWPEPDNLENPIEARIDANLTREPGVPRQSLDTIFDHARFAAETRLRFINDVMVAHPTRGYSARFGPLKTKRLRTNWMIHNAGLMTDASLAALEEGPDGMGWTKEERTQFTVVYEFTIAQAQLLANCANATSTLPQSLQAVFQCCAYFTDAYVDWTIGVTGAARRQTQALPGLRFLSPGHPTYESRIRQDNLVTQADVRDSYSAFQNQAMPAMIALIEDANDRMALHEVHWNNFVNGMDATINAINVSPATRKYYNLTVRETIDRMHYHRAQLIQPTGSQWISTGSEGEVKA
ncbi:hypothetical protein GGR57DRAFT_426365 [Xylariaceae sp. FL1272]|nr:hypothetical protein GGR57DRAFT_426365 [Xylariaceae sp. FL1272]